MELIRRFSPLNLLMISINGMLGSAWLFAPLYAAKIAGSGALIAWLIGGIATTLIALTFAELSVIFPVAGGSAQIPQMSHGSFTSFVLSWTSWLSALTMAPIEVQAVLQYASTYFSSLTHIVNGIPILTTMGMLWATLLMLALSIINVISYKGLIRFNSVLFFFKTAVIVFTVFLLTSTQFTLANFTNSNGLNANTTWQKILEAVASGGIAFAFTGFKHGIELAGEAKRSALAVPLAAVGSILCCLILYLSLQVAFIGALSADSLAHGWGQLRFVGDVGPFAGLAAGLGLVWLLKFLYIDAAVSPLGAGLIYVTSTARILYAMSKIGYIPRCISQLNSKHLPVVAIFINFSIGMFLFLPLPGWQAMVSFLVSAMVVSYAMGPIAVLCLRQELPETKRQFRIPVVTLVCTLAFYFCNLLSYWTGWATIYKLMVAIGIGVIIFFISHLSTHKTKRMPLDIKAGLWLIPYFVGLATISYLGAFGGLHIIPFGWDFLVIAIFSVAILALAVQSRLRLRFHNHLSTDASKFMI